MYNNMIINILVIPKMSVHSVKYGFSAMYK